MLKLFYTSNSIDVIYQSYGRKSISWLQSRNSYEHTPKRERTVYILLSSNFDMNIDLMSVFICHHAHYIDATSNIVLHGKLAVFTFFFASKNLFVEILLFYCSVYRVLLTVSSFSSRTNNLSLFFTQLNFLWHVNIVCGRLKEYEKTREETYNRALLTNMCQRYFVNFSCLSTPPPTWQPLTLLNITVEL